MAKAKLLVVVLVSKVDVVVVASSISDVRLLVIVPASNVWKVLLTELKPVDKDEVKPSCCWYEYADGVNASILPVGFHV